jgi:hypothetical protein
MADELFVAGETTDTRVCKVFDLSALTGETTRGENIPVPYVEGRLEVPSWLDQIDTNLELRINGFWTVAGAVAADISDALDDNVEHYRALFRDNADAAGRVEIELHTGNRVLEGMMQCLRWEPVRTGPGTKTVIARVVVGSGRLTVPAP